MPGLHGCLLHRFLSIRLEKRNGWACAAGRTGCAAPVRAAAVLRPAHLFCRCQRTQPRRGPAERAVRARVRERPRPEAPHEVFRAVVVPRAADARRPVRLAVRGAQPHEQLRDRNPHRAYSPQAHSVDAVGRSAVASRPSRWRDDRRSARVGRAVGVAADARIEVVHARAAADALQRRAQLLVRVGLRGRCRAARDAARAGRRVRRRGAPEIREVVVIAWPVAERVSRLDSGTMCSSFSTTFSIPMIATCVGHRRRQAAVAFVLDEPGARVGRREVHAGQADVRLGERAAQRAGRSGSARRRPRCSACRGCALGTARRCRRASCGSPASRYAICSPASCTMNSPMSDSMQSTPCSARAWFSSISSLAIDLPLITRRAFACAMPSTIAFASAAVSAQCTCTPASVSFVSSRSSSAGNCASVPHGFAEVAQLLQLGVVGELRRALALQEVHRAAKALRSAGSSIARAGSEVAGATNCTVWSLIGAVLAGGGGRAGGVSVTITTHRRRGPCAP